MTTQTVTTEIQITPEMLAKAFWGLFSNQQVEFLHHLANIIKEDNKVNSWSYSLGELQWHYVGDELEKPENKEAKDMLMTMAAPLYFHTLNNING